MGTQSVLGAVDPVADDFPDGRDNSIAESSELGTPVASSQPSGNPISHSTNQGFSLRWGKLRTNLKHSRPPVVVVGSRGKDIHAPPNSSSPFLAPPLDLAPASSMLAGGVGQSIVAACKSPPPLSSRPSSFFLVADSPPPVIVLGVGQCIATLGSWSSRSRPSGPSMLMPWVSL